MPAKYRLYVDEVGNSDLRASEEPNHRYLSLTGVAMELSYVDSTAAPALESLKRKYFATHADEPIIFHRKELVNQRPPFAELRDPAVERRFNSHLLRLLKDLEYTVVTVVIDKREHRDRYKVWRYDPYHYCLMVLLERYVMWLSEIGAVGDVMAESRGGREDRRLKASFCRLCSEGTDNVDAAELARRLTSRELKVKLKLGNIAGLQIADLIAHPSFKAALAAHQKVPLTENFGARVAEVLDLKYRKGPKGRIEGWGRKWLP